jgi:HK97 gp10 family phage protein
MTGKFKVEGFKELAAALRELPKATQRNNLTKALMPGAETIRDIAKAASPVDEGDLRESIAASKQLTRTAKKEGRRETKSFVEVHVGPSAGHEGAINYATNVEFGTKFALPQPYMRVAWDAGKQLALDMFKRILGSEIEKSAARLAKKTARLRT